MKTIITKEDNVIGFDRQVIDPVETNKKVSAIVEALPEFAALQEHRSVCAQVLKELGLMAMRRTSKAQVQAKEAEFKTENDKLIALGADLNEKIAKIKSQNLIYFEPKKGEYPAEDSEVEALAEKLVSKKSYEDLKRDGSTAVNVERKKKDKDSLIGHAERAALQMRLTLETKGDSEALTKSKAWYDEQLAEIEKEYGNE